MIIATGLGDAAPGGTYIFAGARVMNLSSPSRNEVGDYLYNYPVYSAFSDTMFRVGDRYVVQLAQAQPNTMVRELWQHPDSGRVWDREVGKTDATGQLYWEGTFDAPGRWFYGFTMDGVGQIPASGSYADVYPAGTDLSAAGVIFSVPCAAVDAQGNYVAADGGPCGGRVEPVLASETLPAGTAPVPFGARTLVTAQTYNPAGSGGSAAAARGGSGVTSTLPTEFGAPTTQGSASPGFSLADLLSWGATSHISPSNLAASQQMAAEQQRTFEAAVQEYVSWGVSPTQAATAAALEMGRYEGNVTREMWDAYDLVTGIRRARLGLAPLPESAPAQVRQNFQRESAAAASAGTGRPAATGHEPSSPGGTGSSASWLLPAAVGLGLFLILQR